MQSAPNLFGSHLLGVLSGLATLVITCLFIVGVRSEQGYFYFLVTVGGLAVTFAWQLHVTDFNNKQHCRKALAVSSYLVYVALTPRLIFWLYIGRHTAMG